MKVENYQRMNTMEDQKHVAGVDEDYLPQLQAERDSMDPSYQHATRLLAAEIDRVKSGGASEDYKYIEVNTDRPVKVSVKVLIPNKTYPKYNFVGKLLGTGGQHLKKLQADTMTRMAILGRGSMKDKKKEDELRKQGGKNAHLNEPLHLEIRAMGQTSDEAYQLLMDAVKHMAPFLKPDHENNPLQGGGAMGGMPPVRGGYENGGGEPERAPRGPAMERPPYREDPYYQEPAPPAPARGFDDYRSRDPYDQPPRAADYDRVPPMSAARDPYERAPAPRGEYDRMPASGGPAGRGAGRSAAGPAPARSAASRDSYYDFPAASSQRERYPDQYPARGGGASSGGSWGAPQGSFKGAGAPARPRLAAERSHPYPPTGRGAPRY